jgi:hypothetical protein
MPITFAWGDTNKTILISQVREKWTWNEYYEAKAESREMRFGRDVHIIMDMTYAIGMPSGAITHFRATARDGSDQSPEEGQVLSMTFVGANRLFRSLSDVVLRLVPSVSTMLYFVDTIDEAYTVIGALGNTASAH